MHRFFNFSRSGAVTAITCQPLFGKIKYLFDFMANPHYQRLANLR